MISFIDEKNRISTDISELKPDVIYTIEDKQIQRQLDTRSFYKKMAMPPSPGNKGVTISATSSQPEIANIDYRNYSLNAVGKVIDRILKENRINQRR